MDRVRRSRPEDVSSVPSIQAKPVQMASSTAAAPSGGESGGVAASVGPWNADAGLMSAMGLAQMSPADGAEAGAAPGAAPQTVDDMIAAMGLPALPTVQAKRERALKKMGMDPALAAPGAAAPGAAAGGSAPGAAPGAEAGAAGGAPGAAAAQGKMVTQNEGGEVGGPQVRDVSVSNSGGSPLNPQIAQAMGGAMGADFSDVMVHQDGQAEAMGAHAFATGNHVHFAQGQLDTSSQQGLALLGHELTHVQQQAAGQVSAPQRKGGGNAVNVQDARLEGEADRVGAAAAAAVSSSIIGLPATGGAPAAATQQKSATTQSKPGTVQLSPIVQAEPITIAAIIAGLTTAEGIAAAAAVASVGQAAAAGANASLAQSNRAGATLRVPDQGNLFAVSESGRDIIAATIRVVTFKRLKQLAEQAIARTTGDQAAKEAAGRAAAEAGKDNARDNATQTVKNTMQGLLQTRQEEFVWNDQDRQSKVTSWGSISIMSTGGHFSPYQGGALTADFTEADVTAPPGTFCEYFQLVRMSATCNDSTVEWWDKLEVVPTSLTIRDATGGRQKVVGEAGFGWEDSTTKMTWAEENPIGVFGIMSPTREGEAND